MGGSLSLLMERGIMKMLLQSGRDRASQSRTRPSNMARIRAGRLRPHLGSFPRPLLLPSFDLSAGGDACLKGSFEAHRLIMLFEEVREGGAG